MKKYLFLFVVSLFFVMKAAASDLNPLLESSMKYKDVRVARVQAVDTILLENNDKISLIGIKGPKAPKQKEVKRDSNGFIIPDEDPTTPFELEALQFARGLAEGKAVRLEFDTQRRDEEGNLQAYVVLPTGQLLNRELLRNGYAELKLVPPNMKYASQLRAAYQEARREMRGLQGAW